MRILKSAKILSHSLLISQVITEAEARFKPSISLIKKTIENLIDKGYIERKPETEEYEYVK